MTYKMRKILPIFFIAVVLIFSFTVTGNALVNTDDSNAGNILGDADGDGAVTIRDVTEIQRDIAEIPVCDGYSELAADTNGNGKIDINDATIVQRWLAEFETPYPIGEPIDIPEPTTEPTTQMPTDDEGWGRIIFKP